MGVVPFEVRLQRPVSENCCIGQQCVCSRIVGTALGHSSRPRVPFRPVPCFVPVSSSCSSSPNAEIPVSHVTPLNIRQGQSLSCSPFCVKLGITELGCAQISASLNAVVFRSAGWGWEQGLARRAVPVTGGRAWENG